MFCIWCQLKIDTVCVVKLRDQNHILFSRNLSNNKIWWTIEDASGIFHGLNSLMKFHLAGNRIKSINEGAFLGLHNVTYLNLSNNNITSIQNNAFEEMPVLKVITLEKINK